MMRTQKGVVVAQRNVDELVPKRFIPFKLFSKNNRPPRGIMENVTRAPFYPLNDFAFVRTQGLDNNTH
jgi:hypothetical protein